MIDTDNINVIIPGSFRFSFRILKMKRMSLSDIRFIFLF